MRRPGITNSILALALLGLAVVACDGGNGGVASDTSAPPADVGEDVWQAPDIPRAPDIPTAPDLVVHRELRLMTFNLRTMFGNDGEDAWPYRRDIAAEVVSAEAPDVFGTQEGWLFQLADLAERLPDYEWTGTSRQGDQSDEFCAVFWRPDRFEVLEEETFWLSDTPDVPGTVFSDAQCCPRIVTWVRLRPLDGGESFVVANTHFDTTNTEDVPVRSAALCVQRFATEQDPVFLMGDFNEGPEDLSWRVLTGAEEWEGVRGDFVDPWVVLELPEQGTFHGFDGTASTARIDWILARGGATPTEARVETTSFDGRYPSDHFPVTAAFTLP